MNGTLAKMAVTISPPDRTSKYNRLEGIYREDKFILNKKLRLCSRYFILYPELDLQGRLHYHGIIKINDAIKWYKSVLPYIRNTIGFVCIKPLPTFKDELKWLMYCQKNTALMQAMIKEPIIIHKPLKTRLSDTRPSDLDGILAYLI